MPPGGVSSTATAPGAPNCSSPPVTVPEERCTSSGVEPWMGREGIEKLEGIHGCEGDIHDGGELGSGINLKQFVA